MKTVLHWFRRDLRITDNTALREAARQAEQVVPVYVASDWRGTHGWTGANRQGFLCGSLASLQQNLASIGGSLVIRRGEAVGALLQLAQETGAEAIFTNTDPDPFGRAVEKKLAAASAQAGLAWCSFHDVSVQAPDAVRTQAGGMFRVYTPYNRAWQALDRPTPHGRLRRLSGPTGVRSLPVPSLADWGLGPAGRIPGPGERAARERLTAFLRDGIAGYGVKRDTPAGQTTSRLSQDLRWGLISPREAVARTLQARDQAETAAARKSAQTFLNELVWREFYLAILWHHPGLLDADFNPEYAQVIWDQPGEQMERWKAGETGFPIVDAAMRQLAATGFMHNRARMITAMFLTKDLHVHWRAGEQWFMQQLVDGEIASNNGGWQWSAGTGADAAPYFRIQNPWTQSQRFDSEGEYIQEWVPELRGIAPARLHEPPRNGLALGKGYPLPMVDHRREREETLRRFKEGRANGRNPLTSATA